MPREDSRQPPAAADDPVVLIVDDDPVIRKLLQVNFEMEGFEVRTAEDGVEALNSSAARTPDIVIADVMMPRMDGLQLMSAFRADPRYAQLPVILLGAKATLSNRDVTENSGADVFLAKPFDPLELIGHTRRLLEKKAPIQAQPDDGELVAMTIIDGDVRMVELAPDGSYRFVDAIERSHALLYTYSIERELYRDAVHEFEYLLNARSTRESHFQEFFERNPEFVTGIDYTGLRAHVALERVGQRPLVPDFLLQPAVGDFGDILELKSPKSTPVVASANHPRVAAAVVQARAQLRSYHDYFEFPEHQRIIRDKYGFTAFRPKLFIIIGRRGKLPPEDVRRATSDLSMVFLSTYDDILDRMKARLRRVT